MAKFGPAPKMQSPFYGRFERGYGWEIKTNTGLIEKYDVNCRRESVTRDFALMTHLESEKTTRQQTRM
jgi:hypothetical protein